MSIVIRESVDVDDVLLELLEDRLDDEDESPVVMNKDLPLKFALTSLNFISELLRDESSFFEQVITVKLKSKSVVGGCWLYFMRAMDSNGI